MAFTKDQTEALGAKLDGSVVKTRQQAGRSFSYIEGWHAIAEANRIFGFDAWDRETVELRQLGEPREIDGKWRVAYLARVRITVRPTHQNAPEWWVKREGCGYGSGIDRDVGSSHESAMKEAETDAMKRALMTFGNPFGLALYDKDQENVERAAPPPRTAPAPADPMKADAEAIAKRLKEAPNIHKLDEVMDGARDTLKKLPRVTYDYLGGLYDKRRTAMESVV